jgi:hypothetical protein
MMKWLSIGAFAVVLLLSSVLASTAHTILILRSGGDLSSGYALASAYVVSALICFFAGYLFARRTGRSPYLGAVFAYLLSELAGVAGIYYVAGTSLHSWIWVVEGARDLVFLLLGTAVGLGRLKG